MPAVDDWINLSGEVWKLAHDCLQRAVCCQENQANHQRLPHPIPTRSVGVALQPDY